MLYDYTPGDTAVLVNVPHAGTIVPPAIAETFSESAQGLPDTDWHVDRLVRNAPEFGTSLTAARYARYVVDLNRGRDDKPLYRGATTGLVPTETFAGEPVYATQAPDDEARRERVETYWQPYHDHLREMIAATRGRQGFAIVFDVHSIRSEVPRLFEGRLPDLNLGTYDESSCAPALHALAAEAIAAAPNFSATANGRFKGGFITRHYGRPEAGVHALQLEIAQACYMDENQPGDFDPDRAAPLIAVLESLIRRLSEWRP